MFSSNIPLGADGTSLLGLLLLWLEDDLKRMQVATSGGVVRPVRGNQGFRGKVQGACSPGSHVTQVDLASN